MSRTAAPPVTDELRDEARSTDASSQTVRGTLVELHEGEEVTFSDLVFAHYFRQTSLYQAAQSGATGEDAELAQAADTAYRNRLTIFQHENGQIVRSYWCTYEVSAVAITEETIRGPWWRFRRIERREPFTPRQTGPPATRRNWRTNCTRSTTSACAPTRSCAGHQRTLPCNSWPAAASHILSYVDRKGGPPSDPPTIRKIVARSNAELADIRHHYQRAAENSTRIVYAGGMLRGALLLAVLAGIAGLVLWAAGAFDRHCDSNMDDPRDSRRWRNGSRRQRAPEDGKRKFLPGLRARSQNQRDASRWPGRSSAQPSRS